MRRPRACARGVGGGGSSEVREMTEPTQGSALAERLGLLPITPSQARDSCTRGAHSNHVTSKGFWDSDL